MIYIEYDEASSYTIKADHITASESIDIDRKAVRHAINRYLTHLDRLYGDPPLGLDGTTIWLVNPATRRANAFFGGAFNVYFLLAKLRILLSDNPQPVECANDIDQSVDRIVARLCEEFEVQYYPNEENKYQKIDYFRHSAHNAFGGPLRNRVLEPFANLRRWIIFYLFIIIRPIIHKIYTHERRPVDVRFWLHPTLPNRNRFFKAPDELESRGRQVGYAASFFVTLSSLRAFILRAFVTLWKAFNLEEPVHVEWFATPADFKRAIEVAPELHAKIQRAAVQSRENDDSPEFVYLSWQLERISPDIVFQYLFIERALDRFAKNVNDDIWSYARQVNISICKMMGLVGDRRGITTVNVAPHYYSETRISNRFSEKEVHDSEKIGLPDLFSVFEPRSATTLLEQGIPSEEVTVVRDKVEAESGKIDEIATKKNQEESTSFSLASTLDDRPMRVLVILQSADENATLVKAIMSAICDFPEIEVVFKPHPFCPPDDALFHEFEEFNIDVTSPNEPLIEVVKVCDICISIYSTATFPALMQATPVIWLPFVSQNHVMMDLINEVGIPAENPEKLQEILDRLINDETFYVEQARDCAMFAVDELVPDTDSPSLVDIIDEELY